MVDMHIPCLCVVILGALPALISPVKNDLFILANKTISRIATPAHNYDPVWSNFWSLTIHFHLIWQRQKVRPTLQSTRTSYDSTEQCVTLGEDSAEVTI